MKYAAEKAKAIIGNYLKRFAQLQNYFKRNV